MSSNSERPKTPEQSSSTSDAEKLSSSPYGGDTEDSPTRPDAGKNAGAGFLSLQAFVAERGAPKPSSRPQTSSGTSDRGQVPADGVFDMSEDDKEIVGASTTKSK